MKKTTHIFLISLTISSFFISSCGKKAEQVTIPENVMSAETSIENDVPTTKSEDNAAPAGEQTNLAPSDTPRAIAEGGLYLPYTPTALAQASGNIVLFFYASWSPAGIATNNDITEKKDTISKDLTILRVNFDDADDMKEQYGIKEQQTFVQVTNTGELIKKWRGANTLEDIMQQIQK